MNTMQEWIAHLQNPLVLAGFGLFIFAALLRSLFMRSGKLTGKEAAPLLNKAFNFFFILAVLAVIGGLALSWQTKQNDEKAQAKLPEQPSAGQAVGVKIEQATSGDQSPAVNSGGNASINFGKAPAEQKKDGGSKNAAAAQQQAPPAQIKQETKGKQSPAVNAQGDVEINYAK